MLHRTWTQLILILLLALMLPVVVVAQSLDQAARQVASQQNAKVLSARTVQEGKKQVHVIKLLTSDGVVKTVRLTVREQDNENSRKRGRDRDQRRGRSK